MTTLAIYPWEDIDTAVRERAEEEIWSDEEFQRWLDEVMGDIEMATELAIEMGPVQGPQPDPTAGMSELEFMAYTLERLEGRPWGGEALAAIENEEIGADFCRQPFLY